MTWYKTERFVLNNYDRKYRRARWHIMMLVRYLCCKNKIVSNKIDKISNKNSELIEKVMLDEVKSNEILDCAIQIINRCLLKQNPNLSIDEILQDRKLFERKETTDILLEYVENMESATN